MIKTYVAVLDISAIVWDMADFQENTDLYWRLRQDLLNFFERIKLERPQILMRSRLLELITGEFPFSNMPDHFGEFGSLVYSFLADLGADLLEYEPSDEEIKSTPLLLKKHFGGDLRKEIGFLLADMHGKDNPESVYFTFRELWNFGGKLKTSPAEGGASKLHETICSDDSDALDNLFARYKPVFAHSDEKHHINRKQGDYVSPLSCYVGKDQTIPQKHLDGAFFYGKRAYSFDVDNNVFIVFDRTIGNIYHAHDVQNFNSIPPSVRRKFRK